MHAKVSPALDIETCAWCERPVRSGDPVAQTATVDIIDGRVAASPARSYHMEGGCYRAAKQQEQAAMAARRKAANAA